MYDISQISFALFLDMCNYLQILFLQIRAMLTLMRHFDNGLEMKLCALSICRAALNDLAPELDVLALLATIFLPVNVVPFPGLKTLLATFMHAFIRHNDLPCRESWTISLLSVKFLSMDNDVSFRLPFGQKKLETSGSVMLIIYYFVLAWRMTLNGRKCGNNLSQVNYTRSCRFLRS